MSKPLPGCSGCGDLRHTVAGCLSESAAVFYERTGRPAKAATIRRQLKRAEDEPLDEMRDRMAMARSER